MLPHTCIVSPYTHFDAFFFYCYGAHRALHSFPTRRSSDLDDRDAANVDAGHHDTQHHDARSDDRADDHGAPNDHASTAADDRTPADDDRAAPDDHRAAAAAHDDRRLVSRNVISVVVPVYNEER